ncbi:MAG: hypothetical protein KVP17_003451 [Porospora cf. gigantea B]|uniref:uncharacterized protein n=1 Tax=Porospora cf. gigantea B TaxID=2853592 RepID=UPI00357182E2|nr:MAG: hypothetical protein KVP17_003451 [Porospora cf. gigantea B]
MGATVVPVPVGRNNISYVVIDTETDDALLIDAIEPATVLHEAKCRGARVVCHLSTHNHWDHVGGNLLLAKMLPDLEFWSSAYEDTPACTRELHDEEVVQFGSLKMTSLLASSHTSGHLMYLFEQNGPSFLFTGDTVFGGGCGRFFEGSALDFQAVLRKFEKVTLRHRYDPDVTLHSSILWP